MCFFAESDSEVECCGLVEFGPRAGPGRATLLTPLFFSSSQRRPGGVRPCHRRPRGGGEGGRDGHAPGRGLAVCQPQR